MYFLVNASSEPLDMQLQSLQVHRSHDMDGTGQHFVWGQGHKMYFLVNPSSPKLFDVATSNFAWA